MPRHWQGRGVAGAGLAELEACCLPSGTSGSGCVCWGGGAGTLLSLLLGASEEGAQPVQDIGLWEQRQDW